MNLNFLVIIISLFSIGVLFYYLTTTCQTKKEGWVNYQDLPYGNIHTGAGDNTRPLSFYDYPIYRQPLNWPVCHLVEYPIPHCRADYL